MGGNIEIPFEPRFFTKIFFAIEGKSNEKHSPVKNPLF